MPNALALQLEKIRQQTQDAIPVPNGGMEGQALLDLIKANPGPVAEVGVNPNNTGEPLAGELPIASPEGKHSSLFDMVSSKYQDKSKEMLAPPSVDRSLASGPKGALPAAKVGKSSMVSSDPYGAELNDSALKDAQQKQSDMSFITNLGRATNQMLAATSKNGKVYNETLDGLDKQAGKGVENIQVRRKAKSEDMDMLKKLDEFASDTERRDPTSAISKAYRGFAKEMGYTVPESTNASQLKDIVVLYQKSHDNKISASERQDAKSDKQELKNKEFRAKNLNILEKKNRDSGLPVAVQLLSDIDMLTDTEDLPGVGSLAGALPGFMVGEKGRDLRQKTGEIRSTALKLKSGGAVTPEEFKRFDEVWSSPGFLKTEDGFRRGIEMYRELVGRASKSIEAGTLPEIKEEYQNNGGLSSKDLSKGNQYSPKTEGSSSNSKPKNIIQNGHSYTLNESTGEYE